jgi:hypothetical protein
VLARLRLKLEELEHPEPLALDSQQVSPADAAHAMLVWYLQQLLAVEANFLAARGLERSASGIHDYALIKAGRLGIEALLSKLPGRLDISQSPYWKPSFTEAELYFAAAVAKLYAEQESARIEGVVSNLPADAASETEDRVVAREIVLTRVARNTFLDQEASR